MFFGEVSSTTKKRKFYLKKCIWIYGWKFSDKLSRNLVGGFSKIFSGIDIVNILPTKNDTAKSHLLTLKLYIYMYGGRDRGILVLTFVNALDP